jgi:ATP-binding cassette subfamily B protein
MQKSELFSDTIANNMKWGKDDATEEEIRAAASIAQADSFVSEFTEGYDTFIAEKGASLSGGQKQRLSIARAIVRKPEILILDDASSALDYKTDAALRRAIKENYKDTTTVIVSQRVSSIMHADLILVLEEGKLIGAGSHEELLLSCGYYRDTAKSQMGGVILE